MSTSDREPQPSWRVWQPESLLERVEEPPAASSPPDAAAEAQRERALAHLRQQAEQAGYAAGEQRGLEEGRARGYHEGFSQGEQAGREQGAAAASAEQQAQAQRFTQLVDAFQTALESLDSVIPARLMQLALSAVRALLGKQILCDTSLLLETIRQLMQENLRFTRQIELWVSQQDAALVSEQLGEVLEAHGWTLRVDEQMTPGGCRLTAEEGELDATLATRWKMLCDLSREDDAP